MMTSNHHFHHDAAFSFSWVDKSLRSCVLFIKETRMYTESNEMKGDLLGNMKEFRKHK